MRHPILNVKMVLLLIFWANKKIVLVEMISLNVLIRPNVLLIRKNMMSKRHKIRLSVLKLWNYMATLQMINHIHMPCFHVKWVLKYKLDVNSMMSGKIKFIVPNRKKHQDFISFNIYFALNWIVQAQCIYFLNKKTKFLYISTSTYFIISLTNNFF